MVARGTQDTFPAGPSQPPAGAVSLPLAAGNQDRGARRAGACKMKAAGNRGGLASLRRLQFRRIDPALDVGPRGVRPFCLLEQGFLLFAGRQERSLFAKLLRERSKPIV